MTDGAFERTALTAAAEESALALAKALGLGDEVRVGDEWSIDDGDMMLGTTLSGDADGRIVLAVNDAVGERLAGDAAVLQAAFNDAIAVAARSLGATITGDTVVVTTNYMPTVIIEIIDAGVLTSLAGVNLPVVVAAAAAVEYEPANFDDGVDGHDLADSHAFATLSVLNDVELVVTAELGRTTMAVRDLLGLTPGMVVEIDRVAGSPIDLLVNGRRIAAGEVVVIDEEFGIRITDIAPIGERRR